MKSLLFILLAGYAVRCDENNYYVIEMQEAQPNPTGLRDDPRKPFQVYWNVPTMQCASKKIYFENLFEDYGIIQNDRDRFKGENVTILYDPGLFPALFKNESGGKLRFRNGGVPQEGDLNKHLEEFKKELDRSIPDSNFSGIGIIDFESWRPTFRQNFGVLQPYKSVSIEIERKLHWWWKKQWIEEEAKRRFEEAARTFMEGTLSVAKNLRPRARWGFYGFPYCFNMASNNMQESCASNVSQENDEISWLWSGSTALYPSVYSSAQLSTSQMVSLIRGRVREAARCSQGNVDDILPYFWFRYRDAGFLTETDLTQALSTLYKSRATGIIIWGSSNDVNTIVKCNKLLDYVHNTFGPAIAKYTKPIMRGTEENEANSTTSFDTVTESDRLSLDQVLNTELQYTSPDQKFHTQNHTDDPETDKKLSQNKTDDKTVLQNNSLLIDLILNAVLNSDNVSITSTETPKTKYDKKTEQEKDIISTSELTVKISTDASQITNIALINNPLLNKIHDKNYTQSTTDYPVTETIIVNSNVTKTISNNYDATEDSYYRNELCSIIYNEPCTETADLTTDTTDFSKNEKKDQTNAYIITIDNRVETVTDTSEKIEITSSVEFIDTDLSTERNNNLTEMDGFTTDSNIFIDTTNFISFDDQMATSTETKELSKPKTSNANATKFNSVANNDKNSVATVTSPNFKETVTKNLPEIIEDDFTTEDAASKTTEEVMEGRSSPIVPTIEQVVVY